MPVVAPADRPGTLLSQISETGYARVRLNGAQKRLLAELYDQTMVFSRWSAERKSRFRTPRLNNGYRPLGSAHAGDPNLPDHNDSFLYWGRRSAESIPAREEIAPLLSALESYRGHVAAAVMYRLVVELCEAPRKGAPYAGREQRS